MPYRALWVGDGPLRPSLEREAEATSVPVEFPGHLGRSRVFELLAESSALLLTSAFETLPLAVLEAYSQGAPVVCGRFEGVEDFVVHESTGLIVDADDSGAAAAALARLLGDPRLRSRLGEGARRLFTERFSGSEVMAQAYAEQYAAVAVRRDGCVNAARAG